MGRDTISIHGHCKADRDWTRYFKRLQDGTGQDRSLGPFGNGISCHVKAETNFAQIKSRTNYIITHHAASNDQRAITCRFGPGRVQKYGILTNRPCVKAGMLPLSPVHSYTSLMVTKSVQSADKVTILTQ